MSRFQKTNRVDPGTFDTDLILCRWQAQKDEGGGQAGVFVPVHDGQGDVSVVGSLSPVNANPGWRFGQQQEEELHIITCQFVPALEGQAGMVWQTAEGRLFKILGTVNVDNLDMYHRCTCQELKPRDKG